MTRTTYRAAYWISADGQADLALTTPDMRHDCDEALMIEALRVLEETGALREDGDRILIGDYTA
jgi:hypothetical protein